MTTMEELTSRGFHFFCFTTRTARAGFSLRRDPDFACVEVDEVYTPKRFEVFYLGVQKLHHVPVKFTRPLEAV